MKPVFTEKKVASLATLCDNGLLEDAYSCHPGVKEFVDRTVGGEETARLFLRFLAGENNAYVEVLRAGLKTSLLAQEFSFDAADTAALEQKTKERDAAV
ncbi:MAG: hypothetical protein ACK52I_23350 [Pseudomonadota bacterium]|jgi:hypothetical protein